MTSIVYKQGDDTYTVQLILDSEDVDTDYNTVTQYSTIESPDEYKQKMRVSIEQRLGFSILKNGVKVGFMYNLMNNKRYESCSIYLPDPIILIVAFKTVFELSTHKKISFIPHKGELHKFSSITTKDSIKRHQLTGGHINVYKHLIYDKGEKIFHYLGIE